MRVQILSPTGHLTYLPMDLIVWRMGATHVKSDGLHGAVIGVGIQYVVAGTTATAQAVTVDLETRSEVGIGLAAVGFPRATLEENLARWEEAVKILHNAQDLRPNRIEAISKQLIEVLPKVYHELLDALMNRKAAQISAAGWLTVVEP